MAQFGPMRHDCVSPKFANTRGPYSLNSWLTLDASCVPAHGVLRTPMRVMRASMFAPFASSTSPNSVVAAFTW